MNLHVLTLFPEMFKGMMETSIIKRALALNQANLNLYQIRDFTTDPYRRVDTPPIGGGAGLVLKYQPIASALASISQPGKKIILSPRGKTFQQADALRLTQEASLTFICGHYEGFDERLYPLADETISLGDFIMTGGEIAAMAIIDAIIRLIPGVIEASSLTEESFSHGLLEYPQYTEPRNLNGQEVPPILYSGHHDAIRKWRLKQALRMTKTHRPDLLQQITLTTEMKQLLEEIVGETESSWEIDAIEKGKKFTKK